MSPRKLTESDKKEILDLYRLPQETTSTLAERYSVSSSTISRFLKSRLAGDEYEELIQQKRLSRTPSGAAQVLSQYQEQTQQPETASVIAIANEEEEEREQSDELQTAGKIRRSRRRRSSVSEPEVQSDPQPLETPSLTSKPMPTLKAKESQQYFDFEEDETEEDETEVDVHALEEMLGEDLTDLDDELDEEDELDELDEGEWEREQIIPHLRSRISDINILPLSAASFPRNCYLVIDRAAELITRPLEAFSDLGDIPPEEFHQETLPVFDNHKIARRFSKRSQRVIKVPDSQVFQKAKTHLRGKGITRLLLDGQVYSLGKDES